MSTKPFKVQAAAQLLATTSDTVRRMVDESGIEVARQEAGPKTRLFSIENIFELARYRANRRSKSAKKKQVVATVYAPKGGVGKTTLASNFGTIFALKGLRTLVIDLDFQANLTLSFGYDSELTREEALEQGISQSKIVEYHFGNLIPGYPSSSGRITLQEAIKKPYGEYGPHIVPADLNLDRLDTMLTYETLEGRNADLILARLIKDGLSKKDQHFDVSEYDIILFDAAPAKNRITRGALLASDYVISPVSMEKFSTKALSYLSSVLTEMHDQFDRSPELIIVGNFFDPNRVRVMTQLMTITQTYRDAWLESSIRRSEDFPKALTGESDLPLVLSKPSSQAAAELRDSADALLNRMGLIDG
ncbi:ParA family protein [Paraburkholderia aromaticivorans]|uniref:ParA family protein n=1 Tax=Paraburkholderia aromaticivorans TaxID=2026199 RepID=UPI0012FDC02B|nr:ParA family protein [Paraburkholderia aromaticivorans]